MVVVVCKSLTREGNACYKEDGREVDWGWWMERCKERVKSETKFLAISLKLSLSLSSLQVEKGNSLRGMIGWEGGSL